MLPRPAYGLIVGAIWLAWVIYWVISARNAKPIQSQEGPLTRIAYSLPLWISAGLLLFPRIAGGWLTQQFIIGGFARLLAFWLGVAILIAGLAFTVWARRALGGNWSMNAAVKESHELIRTGPYAITRHPIYTGIIVGFLGTAIAIHQWRGPVALLLTAFGLGLKARIEERLMLAQFPEAYAAYRAQVAALIPGIY